MSLLNDEQADAMRKVFSPERLALARRRRGLFVQELALRIDKSPRSVSSWEHGHKSPTGLSVKALINTLGFPKDFFFANAPPVLAGPVFRSLARMSARQRDMAIAAGVQAIELDGWIETHFRRPTSSVPDLRDATPETAAEALRADWGLGYRPVPNLVHLLEANGVRVYSLVHDGTEVDAFSIWYQNVPFIFLNTRKTAERGRMDAAHELAHLVLHSHQGGGGTKQREVEAQTFASCFLMPRAPFIASAPRVANLVSIVEAKQQWGVSALAYIYRLHTLRLISDWHYRALCIEIRSRFGNEEPGPVRQRESSQVLAKVISPTRSGGASRREIAKQLHMTLGDLDEITFGLALTPMVGKGPSMPARSTGEIQLMK